MLADKTQGLEDIWSAGAQARYFKISQITLHVYEWAEELNRKCSSVIYTCTADNYKHVRTKSNLGNCTKVMISDMVS